jgi:putative flippase GtrA
MVVGSCNAVFGYSTYAGLTALFTPHIPYPYMAASVIAFFTNITFSFLNYKWFIFKTKGHYIEEWMRCVTVYSSTMVTGTLILPFVVFAVRHLTPAGASAPYIAGALMMVANFLAGFLGHRNFSFSRAESGPSDEPPTK